MKSEVKFQQWYESMRNEGFDESVDLALVYDGTEYHIVEARDGTEGGGFAIPCGEANPWCHYDLDELLENNKETGL